MDLQMRQAQHQADRSGRDQQWEKLLSHYHLVGQLMLLGLITSRYVKTWATFQNKVIRR